mgnify:CR=1 FL=1
MTVEEKIEYRQMFVGESEQVSALALSSFNEFIAPEYSEEGIREFHKYVDAEAIKKRVQNNHLLIVAKVAVGIVGMIEIRDQNHVALLFVEKKHQKHGLARSLLQNAFNEVKSLAPHVERITVNSSRHGLQIYEKLGFTQTGPERNINGIIFFPMAKQLDL